MPSRASATAPTAVAGQLKPGAVRAVAQKTIMSPNRVVVMWSAKVQGSRRMKLRQLDTAINITAPIRVLAAGRIYSAAVTLSHSSTNGQIAQYRDRGGVMELDSSSRQFASFRRLLGPYRSVRPGFSRPC